MLARHRGLVAATFAIAGALIGTMLILASPSSESTDDAYVSADVTTIAPKIRGLVSAILVMDAQRVRAGEPLIKIDSEEFDARVETAKADLVDAQAGIAAAEASLRSLHAEELLDAAQIRAAQTAIKSSRAQSDRATTDSRRYEALVQGGAVSRRDAETSRASAVTAEQDVAHSMAMLDVAKAVMSVTRTKRASLEAAQQKANATAQRAQSTLTLALQDQRHTVIIAPIDGIVGKRQVQQGDYVVPGTRLLTLVPLHALYVTANFKETQTGGILPGQRATVHVDALSSHTLSGVVESLAPGSGSQFALLPFEPGNGNFTKIVQRVPVRIKFDADQPYLDRLRPGLSVTAKVFLAH
jgi:membrane fusion protein (multidrug efflux system)